MKTKKTKKLKIQNMKEMKEWIGTKGDNILQGDNIHYSWIVMNGKILDL